MVTVGCCSHIASIILYFSHAKYLASIIKPARFLDDLFSNLVVEESETDEAIDKNNKCKSDDDDDDNSDDNEQIRPKKKTKKTNKKQTSKLILDYSDENLDEIIEHLSQMNLINKIDLEEIKSRISPFGG